MAVSEPASLSPLWGGVLKPTMGEESPYRMANPLAEDRYARTRSAFGSYIGFSEASALKRSPAISIS